MPAWIDSGAIGGSPGALLVVTEHTSDSGFTSTAPDPGILLPGDCNQDGEFDLSDVICLLGHLFQGSPEVLPCENPEDELDQQGNLDFMDCNGDGAIDLSDAVYKLGFLFSGGPPSVQGAGCTSIVGCPDGPACP